ncbi:MAG: metal-sulfur cluster assembly factor [Calditrichaeota bacterium]|nr:MAG: metal-sulfur cluster assembly factor [Calditrichota bacterium]
MVSEAQVWEVLQKVHDPEFPISIVDMGMVYGVKVVDETVHIDMTFTAIGCPAIEIITEDVHKSIKSLPGVNEVKINIVWNPPWSKDKITPRGRLILQEYGVGV